MSHVRSEANNFGRRKTPTCQVELTYSIVGREKTNEYECRVMEGEL